MITDGGIDIIRITEHPELEPAVREKLIRIRLSATKPCAGQFDSSSHICSICEQRIKCASKQGNPRLQVQIVEADILIRLGGKK